MNRPIRRAFTLVEILIVVVILGILASIVVPQFANAAEQAESEASVDQLSKLRNALAVYYVRNGNTYPNITPGNATWGELMSAPGYLREPPVNLWVGDPNSTRIISGNAPDGGYHTAYGWIYDDNLMSPTYGSLWAGAFDAQDRPYPRP